jgi:hypothetical protein
MQNRIAFYTILFGLQLLLVEGILQSYYRLTAGDWLFNRVGLPIYEVNEDRYYRVIPNLSLQHSTNEFEVMYHTNDRGFRSAADHRPATLAKPDDVYRIVFTGPSFAFGIAGNYEEIYVRLIENGLNIPNKKIEIINIGTPGQSPNRQMCWIERVAPAFDPDMVIQTIYGEINLVGSECVIPDKPVIIEDGFLYRERPSQLRRITGRLKQSGLVFYTWYIYQAVAGGSQEEGLGTEFYDDEKKLSTENDDADFIALTTELYAQNQQLISAALGADTAIAYLHIPYSFVVRPSDSSRWTHLDEKVRDPYEQRLKAQLLTAALQSRSVNFINSTAALVARDQLERTYNFLDIHFTPAGNEATAAVAIPALEKFIRANLLEKQALGTAGVLK